MSSVIVIQHCQSEHHINQLSGGWTNTPLTGLGRKLAELVAGKLKKLINGDGHEYVLYASDLLRAKQTAEIIGKQLGLVVTVEQDLREINNGVAAGKTKDWARENRNLRTGNVFDIDYQEFQDGETWRQFYHRVCNCMDRICNWETEKNLIIVTHGGTLSYIVAWWMNFDPQMLATSYFSASVGSISVLTQNDFRQNVLAVFNDTSHLMALM